MDAIRKPLERVAEGMQWFLAVPEVRLVHIVASSSIRLATLEQVALAEHSSDNQTPFVVLEAPVEVDEPGWGVRAAELFDDWEKLRGVYATAEPPVELVELAEPIAADLPSFGRWLKQVADSLPPECPGLTVVLASLFVRDPNTWRADLNALLDQPELGKVRWVVVDVEDDHLESLRVRHGAAVEFVDARVGPEEAQAGVQAMMAMLASVPVGADGPRRAGMAGPSVAPPRRWNAPEPPPAEVQARELFDAGVPAGLADEASTNELKRSLLTAAEAAQRGDTAAATYHQGEACRQASSIGLEREALTLQILLGSYFLQGAQNGEAERVFTHARDTSIAYGYPDAAVQAELSLGSTLLLDKRPLEAAQTMENAGNRAADLKETAIAVEAYRTAGQAYVSADAIAEATTVWRRALEVAGVATVEERAGSSAVDVAEELEALCRERGLEAQADSMAMHAALLRAEVEGELPSPAVEGGA